MTVSEWVKAGPFEVWVARGPVHPEHESQSVGLRLDKPGRGRDRAADLAETLLFSRDQWAEFVKVIKEGKLDV